MGVNSSNFSKDLITNEYLIKLSGTDYISPNEPFWNQLLSFSFVPPTTYSDQKYLEDVISPLCKNFVLNNCKTGNFGSLIRVFLLRAAELLTSSLCIDELFTRQAYNALFIIRIVCKYFVENLSEQVVVQQFETVNFPEENIQIETCKETLVDEFLSKLIQILVGVPNKDMTLSLHMECLNIILTLLSIQLFQNDPSFLSVFHEYFMEGKSSRYSLKLMKVLFENYISQCKQVTVQHGSLYGVTSAVASGIWSVVTLGMANQKPDLQCEVESALANQSLLLLLVLCNQSCFGRCSDNPFQTIFLSLHDESPDLAGTSKNSLTLSFSQLYTTICQTIKRDTSTLLLYMLLHRVEAAKSYFFSKTNIEQLVLPLLEMLYNSASCNSQHLYMALIIILILSEDNSFNIAIHSIRISNHIAWFQECSLSEITLGSFMVLILVRTIQHNMTRMRDQYLHTNCLGALANMSSHIMNLHPYAAQRLVGLFVLLLKKYKKTSEKLKTTDENGKNEGHDNITLEDDIVKELAIIEDVIRMTLEILNSCLCHSLNYNPNLIYNMLYQKEMFLQLSNNLNFQDIVFNIEMILVNFSTCLEKQGNSLSVSEVLKLIKQTGQQFRKDRLKKFAELKFRYIEEERPEEFFIPYVWSLVYKFSNIYFRSTHVGLFPI